VSWQTTILARYITILQSRSGSGARVTLRALEADIDGEPGVGYILRPGFLPPPLSFKKEEIHALVVGAQWVSRRQVAKSIIDLARVRQSLREQRKMRVVYDEDEAPMERTLWPIMLGFIENQRFIAGWCELTADFRLFRTDRIVKSTS